MPITILVWSYVRTHLKGLDLGMLVRSGHFISGVHSPPRSSGGAVLTVREKIQHWYCVGFTLQHEIAGHAPPYLHLTIAGRLSAKGARGFKAVHVDVMESANVICTSLAFVLGVSAGHVLLSIMRKLFLYAIMLIICHFVVWCVTFYNFSGW